MDSVICKANATAGLFLACLLPIQNHHLRLDDLADSSLIQFDAYPS